MKSFIKFFLKILLGGCLAVALLSIVLVLPWRWIPPPTSAFMLTEQLKAGRKPGYHWVPMEDISPCMGIAVVAAEDQKFPRHYGFDLESIAGALKEERGGRRGASTISQQVAKNLFLWKERSYVRKAIEAYLTVFIETLWPKRRILEIYLNLAEFGPGVYGVGAASLSLRGKPASRLSPYDCAVLTAVLPNPKRLSAAKPSDYVRSRASHILGQINSLGGPRYLEEIKN